MLRRGKIPLILALLLLAGGLAATLEFNKARGSQLQLAELEPKVEK